MSAGRSCPLSYRYPPGVFQGAASASTDTLYVVGGLYGNEAPLDTVLRLFSAERGRKRLIFNGDFDWFNIDPASFLRINEAALSFDTFLAQWPPASAAHDSYWSRITAGIAYTVDQAFTSQQAII